MSNLNDVITYGTAKFKVVRNLTSENINDFYMAIPLGSIIPYSVNSLTLPKGFLLCDGSAVSRSTYDDLFAAIGTTYGIGDGETTFNLPNLNSGKFLEGASTAGTSKDAGLPNITGYFTADPQYGSIRLIGYGSFYGSGAVSWCTGGSSLNININNQLNLDASRSSAIYGNSTTVQPSSLTVRYIIKAYNIFENDPIFDDIYDELNEKFDYRTDFTIIYPNGGTEQNPANVTKGNRYIEPNPFPGYIVNCVAEIFVGNQWYESGIYNGDANYNGGYTKAGQVNDTIVVQVGLAGVTHAEQGRAYHIITGSNTNQLIQTAPCRIKIWKIGKIINNT